MSDSNSLLCHSEDRIDQLEKEVFTNNLSDRMSHLERRVKELEKDRYQRENLEPEKESPPFKSWVK